MTVAAIETRALGVRLGRRHILHDVDLRVPQGRWTSVVGPNGAGKSTLLKALAGLLPIEGAVSLFGRSLHGMAGRERARLLAWLGQNEVPVEDLCGYDVVMLGRLPHQPWLGAPSAEDHAVVQRALHTTQAWGWHERPLAELSGGERQRVLLARALAVQARVLLMDEPLANLDPPHQTDWLHTVRALVARGDTVVSVLHEISIALQADDMVVMAEGRVVWHGACADAATHDVLERVFDHRIRVREIDGTRVALPRL
jgi:iron complex transport system ATP-binding protein